MIHPALLQVNVAMCIPAYCRLKSAHSVFKHLAEYSVLVLFHSAFQHLPFDPLSIKHLHTPIKSVVMFITVI